MADQPAAYAPPEGAHRELTLKAGPGGNPLRVEASAEWLLLRKKEKPLAEIFHVYYRLANGTGAGGETAARPLTFVFNGGPGASSAYLHVGALGPRRALFNPDGSLQPPPTRLADNAESWLGFTDLVFVDPVGTGFSRVIPEAELGEGEKGGKPGAGPEGTFPAGEKGHDENEFFKVNRDLESLGEFISKFMSRHGLWSRPVFIAGESYGGFRVAKLARKLQEGFGVGLNGAILISPALEYSYLEGSEYEPMIWCNLFPSLALAAFHHGKSRAFTPGTPLEQVRKEAEKFAAESLLLAVAHGDLGPEAFRTATLRRAAEMAGLSEKFMVERGGRVSAAGFVRELLREEHKVCGLYDATATSVDPYPDRDSFQGADPTLFAIERVFTGAINIQVREVIGLKTERDYQLLSMEVNEAWKADGRKHDLEGPIGATDDLRYGMALNPFMKVHVTHGIYDLITPYFASERLVGLMKLQPAQRAQLSLRHYRGGHMFYAWEESRTAFQQEMRRFYAAAVG